ncbi:unnamed protein product, partial [Laminaria digitata]
MLSAFLTLGLLVTTLTSFSQSSIKGRVTSTEDNDGLPGATVLVKGTSTGTITDYEGRFTITASTKDVLVVTYVGFLTQE